VSEKLMLDPPKPPTIQIVVDCHRQPIGREALRYVEHLFGKLVGSDRMLRTFWVTRCDLLHDFEMRIGWPQQINSQSIASEVRHEPSFDLYEDGGYVPVARLVNLAAPQPFELNLGLEPKP
jgi:hypothetical protein